RIAYEKSSQVLAKFSVTTRSLFHFPKLQTLLPSLSRLLHDHKLKTRFLTGRQLKRPLPRPHRIIDHILAIILKLRLGITTTQERVDKKSNGQNTKVEQMLHK